MSSELHLFIIWERAQYLKGRILDDISAELDVEKIVQITWSKEKFLNNLLRFYGKKLLSFRSRYNKMREVGTGSFTLIIVRDKKPEYDYRVTTRKKNEYVNIHMFDKKDKYRKWINTSNSRIHCTINEKETSHDLMLLLGIGLDEFEFRKNDIPESIETDIIGSNGWENAEQMFKVLNATTNYVVLRNFEYLPKSVSSDLHSDIDILTDDQTEIVTLLGAKKVVNKKFRAHYSCKVGSSIVRFDFRYLGDNYYCLPFEQAILSSRLKNEHNIYIPDKSNYSYSLLYHALVQKPRISDDYKDKLYCLFGECDYQEQLYQFMNDNGYTFEEPIDLSVYYDKEITGKVYSKNRQKYIGVTNMKKRILSIIGRG